VAAVDAALAGLRGAAPAGVLLSVSGPRARPPGELRLKLVDDDDHPLQHLLGFVAPDRWSALGVSTTGLAHAIDDEGRVMRRPDSPRVRITVLLDRTGGGTGLLRRGDELTPLPGTPEGMVADACRRALGLPTAPPPATTVGLWTACWLDRVVRAGCADRGAGKAGDPHGQRFDTWDALVQLHPAESIVRGRGAALPGSCSVAGPGSSNPRPEALARATWALAEAWPWARLRADPGVLDVPDPLPDRGVIAWMDDGMWARWLLASFPSLSDLADAGARLLAPELADAVRRSVEAFVD
jgi:hypothetical protein